MYEAQPVDRFDRQSDFSHVEPGNIFREDLVLDEHSHQITTGQELHEHVKERRVLERSMQLHQPRTVCVRKDITFSADVSKLVLFVLQQG
jgi:hypothetical protein